VSGTVLACAALGLISWQLATALTLIMLAAGWSLFPYVTRFLLVVEKGHSAGATPSSAPAASKNKAGATEGPPLD
jgi:hypothetical protein